MMFKAILILASLLFNVAASLEQKRATTCVIDLASGTCQDKCPKGFFATATHQCGAQSCCIENSAIDLGVTEGFDFPDEEPVNGAAPAQTDPGTSNVRGKYTTDCFLKTVHESYVSKVERGMVSKTVFSVTVYLQERYNVQHMKESVRSNIDASNTLFAPAGVAFGDVQFRLLPKELEPDQITTDYREVEQIENAWNAHFDKVAADQFVIVFTEGKGLGALGSAFGGFPFVAKPTPRLFMRVSPVRPYFTTVTFTHELGHSLGLFHTFQRWGSTYPDCADPAYAFDTIPDTAPTARVDAHFKKNHDILGICDADFSVPCSDGKKARMDTRNRMSYGFCRDVGGANEPALTTGQFARIACSIDKHLHSMRRAGSPLQLTTPREKAGYQIQKLLPVEQLIHIGHEMQVDLGKTVTSIDRAFLWETDSAELPALALAAEFQVDVELADGVARFTPASYSSGFPITRGTYMMIFETNQKFFATEVFIIEVNTCKVPNYAGAALIRTKQDCEARRGYVHEEWIDSERYADAGVICCAPEYSNSMLMNSPNVGVGVPFGVLGLLAWQGGSLFWGEEVEIRVTHLFQGELIDRSEKTGNWDFPALYFVTAGKVEQNTVGLQKVTLEAEWESTATFVPRVAVPGAYAVGEINGYTTRAISVVPAPCRTTDGDIAGYCLPAAPITAHGQSTPSDMLCSSRDTASCPTGFACCPGLHTYQAVSDTARYRDGGGNLESAGSSIALASLSLTATVVALFYR